MTRQGYYFGAGPAALPDVILREAQSEFLDWKGTGLSVLEIGHRTDVFKALLQQAELDLRQLLSIPSNYHVLFLGGAARAQFSMIPMNLLEKKQRAGYVLSGLWSKLAFDEAARLSQGLCLLYAE
jgi:phosphoserine aminotransferase